MNLTWEDFEAEIQRQGEHLVFKEAVITNIEELPPGIKSIKSNAYLGFHGLKKLREGIRIVAGLSISLDDISHIPDNVSINSGATVFLNDLVSIGQNVYIAGYEIEFKKLSEIGSGTQIEVDSYIIMDEMSCDVPVLRITESRLSKREIGFLAENDITIRCPAASKLFDLIVYGISVREFP